MSRGLVDVHLQPDGRVFVETFSRDTENGWVMNGLPRVLGNTDDATALGTAVIEAVKASPETTLPARDAKTDPPDREFLAWVGADSYAKYAKGVRAALVHGFFDGEPHLLITPQSNGGSRSGFEPMREHRQKLTDWSPATVGEAVQRALTLATT
jgi:hypothetical protein